jgi:predicted nucleotidyltransferase
MFLNVPRISPDVPHLNVQRIQAVVEDLWGPAAHVETFGSQATGLALPGSDVDLVVLNVAPELRRPGSGFHFHQRKQLEVLLEHLASILRARGVVSIYDKNNN